jgi:hypothetical protein
MNQGTRKEQSMNTKGLIRKISAMTMACMIMAGLLSGQAMAKRADEKFQNTAERIANKNDTEVVKTIHWRARTTSGVVTESEETGEDVRIPAGSVVTVIQRDYHAMNGISQCMLQDGTTCYIANRFMTFTEPLATGAQGDYSTETKEAYVNGQSIPSTTDTLVWISLDKQRINIFKGYKRNWELVRTCRTSTGKADAPTLDVTFKKKYVIQKKGLVVNGLQYYTFFYGSGIHKWPGGGMEQAIGKIPLSHSCARVEASDAQWIFDNTNVPIGSRVWIW